MSTPGHHREAANLFSSTFSGHRAAYEPFRSSPPNGVVLHFEDKVYHQFSTHASVSANTVPLDGKHPIVSSSPLPSVSSSPSSPQVSTISAHENSNEFTTSFVDLGTKTVMVVDRIRVKNLGKGAVLVYVVGTSSVLPPWIEDENKRTILCLGERSVLIQDKRIFWNHNAVTILNLIYLPDHDDDLQQGDSTMSKSDPEETVLSHSAPLTLTPFSLPLSPQASIESSLENLDKDAYYHLDCGRKTVMVADRSRVKDLGIRIVLLLVKGANPIQTRWIEDVNKDVILCLGARSVLVRDKRIIQSVDTEVILDLIQQLQHGTGDVFKGNVRAKDDQGNDHAGDRALTNAASGPEPKRSPDHGYDVNVLGQASERDGSDSSKKRVEH